MEVLPLADAIRIRSAELWLEVGQPKEALRELQRLSPAAWRHPWAARVLQVASHALTARR
jgi:hypothetical protein